VRGGPCLPPSLSLSPAPALATAIHAHVGTGARAIDSTEKRGRGSPRRPSTRRARAAVARRGSVRGGRSPNITRARATTSSAWVSRPSSFGVSASPAQPSTGLGATWINRSNCSRALSYCPRPNSSRARLARAGAKPGSTRRSIHLALPFREQTKGVMRRRGVLVQVSRPEEIVMCLLEVTAPELDLPEVHPEFSTKRGLYSSATERLASATARSPCSRACAPALVECDCLRRQGSSGHACRARERHDDEARAEVRAVRSSHAFPIGRADARVARFSGPLPSVVSALSSFAWR
jgi:hypothetical protein